MEIRLFALDLRGRLKPMDAPASRQEIFVDCIIQKLLHVVIFIMTLLFEAIHGRVNYRN